jgi:peptidyl-tRNA hydrolase, PTH1 family
MPEPGAAAGRSPHGNPTPWLVVGLGNPGPEYLATRHNAGALVADVLADRVGGRFKAHKSRAELVEARLGPDRVVLAKPRSYMNESGGPVAGLLSFFKVPVERLVVVHDELDLPYGSIRLKQGGGDNGHNGLKSVRRSLGTGEFFRVRVGIGRPPGRQDPADWVLREWSSTERKDLDVHVERAADAVEALLADGLAEAQNRYND